MEAVRNDVGTAIIDEIARLEGERARLESQVAARMLEFSDLRRQESELALDPVIARLEASFAADELSLVLLQPTMTVQCRLAETRRVRGLLPLVWQAWREGAIDQARVRLIAWAVDKLESNHSIIELNYRVVDYASSHTVSQTKAWLKRFVARREPDTDRSGSARERRGVYVNHDDDGMSWINAFVSTSDAARIDSLLTGLAKASPHRRMHTGAAAR